MMESMRKLALLLVVLLVVGSAVAWWLAGRSAPPQIEIVKPGPAVGQAMSLELVVGAPGGAVQALQATLEQGELRIPLLSQPFADDARLTQEAPDRFRVSRDFPRAALKGLKNGAARVVVHAERPVLFGLRRRAADAARDVVVRLDPPRVAVISTHHYVNHGGAEMVVYRATPDDVESGVRVGDLEYPGYPAQEAGVATTDPAMRVAFFALLWDQDLATPIEVFARDPAGNQAKAPFEHRVFPKPFRQSRIELTDRFIGRVVPEILQSTPDFTVDDPNDIPKAFVAINSELRRRNAEQIAAVAAKTARGRLWEGAFRQLTNSQVEANFADQRTYFYGGQEVDRQVHLGFDLAVTANVPVRAANHGAVVFAGYLGIYGNCVIVDHGMGVQSLYAHLSSIAVKEGEAVKMDQELGRSGMTGLAGGDHLHFTMLVHGRPVTPVDWWSAQWIEDRIVRKIREAGTIAPAP
jgi:murein DD-endopeptidase MepM/ murein hydrolase activator NlpD